MSASIETSIVILTAHTTHAENVHGEQMHDTSSMVQIMGNVTEKKKNLGIKFIQLINK